MQITNVKINGIKNPIGFQYEKLICSWDVKNTDSKRQTNAAIEVSNNADFCEILYRKESNNIKSSGEEIEMTLTPRTIYYYRIYVEGDNGDTAVSDVHFFETGKMDEPFRAEWIGTQHKDRFHPMFYKNILIEKEVKSARLYITGVGLFEAYLNGEKLGEEYLTPYLSNYEKNIQVMTFPVHGLKEKNKLEILLGKGWYMGTFGLEMKKENYGDKMAVIAELHIEYKDGSNTCICTDQDWHYHGSDIEDSGIYDGEILNRMLHNTPEKTAIILPGIKLKSKLMDRISLPVLAKERMNVKQVIHTPADEVVLDMGQNFAGYIEFLADLPKGTKVTLDFGEILQNGNFYNKNYREAKSQFVYVSNGEKETVRPHFTFFGFRYVKVSGFGKAFSKDLFTGVVLYSDIQRTGYIETGNKKLNRLYENTIWGLKSNFIDMPTDCPQRSERLGWTGDAQVFSATASYHMDTRAFFHKFVKDIKDEQEILNGGIPNYLPNLGHKRDVGSVWGDIGTILPDVLYYFYGDHKEMAYCYPMMKGWVDYIDREDKRRGEPQYLFNFGFHFGDWLALDGATPTSFKGSTEDDYIASVYYYHSAQLLRKMAKRLGYEKDTAKYLELENNISQAVLHEFFTPGGRLAIDTQAAYVIALKFQLYRNREILIDQFKKRLKKDCYQIKCGFVGAPLLCTVLAEAGLTDLAYDFLLKESFPSWLYSVNLGATTIWERWNSVLPDGTISDTGMNSLNHYAYGSVIEFLYGYGAGIRAKEPGFKSAVIEPHPDIRIGSLKSHYDSVNGRYISNWEIRSDGSLKIHIEIPFGAVADVKLPEYTEEILQLDTGSYDFVYMPKNDFRKPYTEQTTLARLKKDPDALAILQKYTPALAGMAASGDIEMGANSLEAITHMHYLPYEPDKLQKAITEIVELIVQ